MSRLIARPVLAACILALAACGGSSRAPTAGGAGSGPEAVAETAPEPSAASGIPGLTVAEVEAQPEAPSLPGGFGVDTSIEEVEDRARRQAEREGRRGSLGELSVDKRARYLTHVWWQGVREIQRGQPSHIAGLTVGELEDQPAAPPLPAIFGLDSTSEDLAHHAFIVASEEHAAGIIGDNLIPSRQRYLVWAWEPLLAERQARARKALEERAARNEYQVADAQRKAQWEADQAAHRRETERLIELEKHKTIPVLTPEEKAELEAIAGD